MNYTREDIAEMRWPTRTDCQTLPAASRVYCSALRDCGLISFAQMQRLIAEDDTELPIGRRPSSRMPRVRITGPPE